MTTTRLEFYTLTDELPPFYHEVVDVIFLRVMALNAWPTPNEPTWTAYVTNALFSRFRFQYDIDTGRMKYAGYKVGGPFDLRRWIRGVNKNNRINSYDQAAIAHIALGLGSSNDKAQ